jgi:hypothetical protein
VKYRAAATPVESLSFDLQQKNLCELLALPRHSEGAIVGVQQLVKKRRMYWWTNEMKRRLLDIKAKRNSLLVLEATTDELRQTCSNGSMQQFCTEVSNTTIAVSNTGAVPKLKLHETSKKKRRVLAKGCPGSHKILAGQQEMVEILNDDGSSKSSVGG